MGNCNTLRSIHSGTGTAQNDRLKPALQTDFFLLDERKEQDFILFIQKLSKYVNFYNEFDVVDNDWSGLFEKESTSILILIANWNITLLQNAYENKKNEIALNSNFSSQKEILRDYFIQIHQEYNDLFEKANSLDSDITIKENLLSTSYVITDRFFFIINQINSSSDITALLKNYFFIKGVQQLFGLLLSWKNYTNSTVEYQLNTYPKHQPHYTLFLSFLKLLNIANEKLNEFTKKHLDFYYKDVLHIQNQDAKPDYVHLVIEPFDIKPFLIPKGTIFPAGKNSLGQNKFYSSTADQTINGIKLKSFQSVHFKDERLYKSDLLSINAKNEGFNVFTSTEQESREALMIASPYLFLQSGVRIIKIRFNGDYYNENDFNFYITGEEKIIEITEKSNSDENDSGGKFIQLTIPATEKKIIPFNQKLHPEFLVQTSFPVIKIVPTNINVIKSIHKIEFKINVNDFKSFVLDSDFGRIDTEKAFYPFGEFPKNGNGIIVSSNEFFMKKNAVATFNLVSDKTSQNYFNDKIEIFKLNNNSYTDKTTNTSVSNSYPLTEYNFIEIASNKIIPNGKIRIELNNSAFEGEKFMLSYIRNSRAKTDLPYKPRIKEFRFDYSVTEIIDLANRNIEINPIEIYRSLSFGYKKLEKETFRFSQNNLLEGTIYLGFHNIAPRDGLNFLIQLEEGTANPLLAPAVLSWEYLDQNVWKELESSSLGDETLSLTQSGLVSITVPEFNSDLNTEFESNLFWIKIGVSNIQAICKFTGVHVQALKAVLINHEDSGTVFTENTPKDTIAKSYNSLNQVKKITQPYNSFGGKVREKDEFLYQRTSERLRHKNRAITTWDYERIILQEFPEVYRVKTLNHYRYDTKTSNTSAGYVTIIPIAKSSNADIINWRPLLSLNTMLLIKDYLIKISSPHVRINVKPPRLEKVQIQFNIKYHSVEGLDSRLYTCELINIINRYLSPWAYESADFNFANEIEFSSLIKLIDNQNFVDYITDFKVTQSVLDENNQIFGSQIQNLNKISPQTDFTLFIPNSTHAIQSI